MDLLSALGTRVCLRLLFELGKADCCEINGDSLSLAQEAHVSLAGQVLIAAAAYKLFSACSLSQFRLSAFLWVAFSSLSANDCDMCSVQASNDFCEGRNCNSGTE